MKEGTTVKFTGTKEDLVSLDIPEDFANEIIEHPEGTVMLDLGPMIVIDFNHSGDFGITSNKIISVA